MYVFEQLVRGRCASDKLLLGLVDFTARQVRELHMNSKVRQSMLNGREAPSWRVGAAASRRPAHNVVCKIRLKITRRFMIRTGEEVRSDLIVEVRAPPQSAQYNHRMCIKGFQQNLF